MITSLCFPNGVPVIESSDAPDLKQYHYDPLVFLSTAENGDVTFGLICFAQDIIDYDSEKDVYLTAPLAYCFLSKVPFFPLHFGILSTVASCDKDEFSNESSLVLKTLSNYMQLTVPEPGGVIKAAALNEPKSQIHFTCPVPDEIGTCTADLQLDWGLPVLLQKLSTKSLLRILACVMLEQHIVIVSPIRRLLSAAVLGLSAIVSPFHLQCVVITELPCKRAFFFCRFISWLNCNSESGIILASSSAVHRRHSAERAA